MAAIGGDISGHSIDFWLIDYGAIHHITSYGSQLVNFVPFCGSEGIVVGDGSKIPISSIGSSELVYNNCSLSFTNLLHAPNAIANLLYFQKICADIKALIEFQSNSFCVKDIDSKEILLQDQSDNDLYKVCGTINGSKSTSFLSSKFSPADLVHSVSHEITDLYHRWHKKVGHPSFDTTLHIIQLGFSTKGLTKNLVFVRYLKLLRHISFPLILLIPSVTNHLNCYTWILGHLLRCHLTMRNIYCLFFAS